MIPCCPSYRISVIGACDAIRVARDESYAKQAAPDMDQMHAASSMHPMIAPMCTSAPRPYRGYYASERL